MVRMWSTVVLVLVLAVGLQAQHQHGAAAGATPSKMTDQQKIANAMSAAPAAIARGATIMDWAPEPGGEPRQLKAGTNGWVCFPSTPVESKGAEDPMCIDGAWQSWAHAWMSKTPPSVTAGIGIAYMLRGDKGASNTDPFATAPTADNQWVSTGPHVMVLLPDPKALDAYSTDPKSGGPYVMWKGTPYAHLMVPVSGGQAKPTMTMAKPMGAAKPAAKP